MPSISNVVSVCRWLPTPDNAAAGIFVQRRLEAMAGRAAIHAVQPVPYCPVVKPLPSWAPDEGRTDGIAVSRVGMFYVPKYLKRLDGYWLYRSVLPVLRRLKQSGQVEVVDAHFGYPDGVGAAMAAQKLRLPVFVTFRGNESDYLDDVHIAPQIRRMLAEAAGCICVSHSLRDLALQFGARPDAIRVIHNAVNGRLFHPRDRAATRAELGVATATPLLVSVGDLIPRKGHDVLLQAFHGVRAEHPGAKLIIIGGALHDRTCPDRISALVASLGLGGAVRIAGRLPPETIAKWLAAADVFTLATRREGCCNAVLEALASGTPVVTTDVGDNARFVDSGANGYIVAIDDPNALARALAAALGRTWDPAHVLEASALLDWDGVAAQVFDFFRERVGASTGCRA